MLCIYCTVYLDIIDLRISKDIFEVEGEIEKPVINTVRKMSTEAGGLTLTVNFTLLNTAYWHQILFTHSWFLNHLQFRILSYS
jgi:hypothetical protein